MAPRTGPKTIRFLVGQNLRVFGSAEKQRVSRGWTRTNADQKVPVILFPIRVNPRESAAK